MVVTAGQPGPEPHAPLIGEAVGRRLHVMTYNLRSATGRAPHSWGARLPLVAELLRRERPTILCTQEGRFRQLVALHAELDGYDWLHLGREGGSRSEATAVFWDRGRLSPLDYDHLWVSRRPRLVGSRSWGTRTVRMLTWVRFEDRSTGRECYIVDNHLDHRSERARRKGALLNLSTVEPFGAPTIITGDFNTVPGSRTHEMFVGAGFADAWEVATERVTPAWGTFNGWKTDPVEGGPQIDWILVRPGVRVHRVAVNAFSRGGVAPSDHWPVQALVSLR